MNQTLTTADIMTPNTLFHHVFHGSPVGMVILDAVDGTYIEINDAFARLLGYSREELVGRPFTAVGLDLSLEREKILDLLRATPYLADIPFALSSRDGHVHTCIGSIQLEKNGGRPYFFAVVQDMTEYEQVRHALQHSESRFSLFFRNIPLPLLVIDEETGRIIDVNPAAGRLYGYRQDEFTQIPSDDLLLRTLQPNGERSAVTRQLLRDGTIIEANITDIPLNLEGRRANLISVEDMTEQRALQAELEAAEERLRIIADMTADAMWDYDLTTGVVTLSAGFSALYGDPNDDGMKRDWWERRIHPDDRQAVEASIEAALNSNDNFWSAEYRYLRRDGIYASVLNNGYITRDADGRVTGFMGSMIDLTRPLEIVEVAARAALEERQRLAHSLHDSVTQSLYSVSLLAEATHRRAESGELDVMTDHIDRLSELTVQALRQMRLLVYELRPDMLEQEGLAGALRHRLEAVEHRAGVKARLIDDTLDPIPPHLQSDLFWIGQEALNNALRHAGATAVTVRLGSDEDTILMEIGDDGRGFDNLWQDETGGLVAVRRHVADMGGELTVDTGRGAGTTLSVRVPRGATGQNTPLLPTSPAGL